MKSSSLKIGFITSAIEDIDLDPNSQSFDSTWQLMEFGKKRGHQIRYILDTSVVHKDDKIMGVSREITNLKAKDKTTNAKMEDLSSFDILLIRKDPPFDIGYLTLMQLLAKIPEKTRIVNDPVGLSAFNEKTSVLFFPEFAPKSLVTCSIEEIKSFMAKQKKGVVVKGLDNKGGSNVYMLKPKDPNTNEILHQITKGGTHYIMCQELLDIEKTGDKRITVIHGKVLGGFLRRPIKGDFRGNMGKGAHTIPATANAKEVIMAKEIATFFSRYGISIIGIDVIGGKCTEINITSPVLSKKFMPDIEHEFYIYLESLCQ